MARVLITGARAPVALHLARLFHAAGHAVLLADSQRYPIAAATRMKQAYRRLPSPRGNVAAYAAAVSELIAEEGIDLVVPTCEEVFFLAAARDLGGEAIPLFAPDFGTLAAAHHKGQFAADGADLGGGPPPTQVVTSAAELRALGYERDRVLKPAWSRFASRVLVRPTPDATAAVVPLPTDPWVVQTYLPGEEICGYGVAVGGRLLAFSAYRPRYRAGAGAGIAFAPADDSAALQFATAYAHRTGWTGQLSFDYRRDAQGTLHAIECNPRAVSGVHFFGPGDGLAEAMLEGRPAMPTETRTLAAPLAMLVYGLGEALRRRGVRDWWRDFRGMADLFAFPGDRGFVLPQLLALAEIASVAVRSGKSLQQAATDDIEWNGEPLGQAGLPEALKAT
ncbi:MAG: hypothetical protein IPK28_16645 [Devosia sp.]|nr:hypothetical protein [Devosia sp.]